jgi:outer membrane protein OmpA-like peptidoglycan-associated protein
VVLKAFPRRDRVEGHTDNTGDAAMNKTLSVERAAAVEKALEGLGVDEARITSAGYGPGKPIASNDTEDGRAQNRRVEGSNGVSLRSCPRGFRPVTTLKFPKATPAAARKPP